MAIAALVVPLGGAPAAAGGRGARTYATQAESASEALIHLALEAQITILNTELCHGQAPRLQGLRSLDAALTAITQSSDCAFKFFGSRAVVIVPKAPGNPPPRAPVSPAVSPPEPTVTELTVTASKREINLYALAGSVSVVSGAHARSIGAYDASDLSGLLAGVATTNLGPGRDKLLLRGLSDGAFTGRAASPVGILLDNVPLTYNAPDPDLRLTDLQRVEVARGPQGALYGAGSVSGIYRMVTNKPNLTSFSGDLAARFGATQGGGLSHAVDGMLNLPLIYGKAALRLAVYDEIQGGYAQAEPSQTSNLDRSTRRGGRAIARLALDDWQIDVTGATQRLQTADAHYLTDVKGKLRRLRSVREAHRSAFDSLSLTMDGDTGLGQVISTSGYVRHDSSIVYDATGQATLGRASGPATYVEQAQSQTFMNDTTLRSADARRFRWLAGVYLSSHQDEILAALRRGDASPPNGVSFSEVRTDSIRDQALYGDLSYDLAQGWTVTAGARLFHTTVSTDAEATVSGKPQSRHLKLTFEGVSPKVSLQRVAGRDGLIYALYSEGYRAGGVNSLGLGRGGARQRFESDRLQNFELGIKLNLLHHRVHIRSALFYDIWRNLQTDQYTRAGGSFTTNIGQARDLGLGFEAEYQLGADLSLEAQGLLTRAELVHFNPKYVNVAARGLPGVPQVSMGSLVRYRRPLTDSLIATLIVQADYVGPSHLTFDAASPVMGDYFSGRLSAALSSSRWTASVFIENPLNASGDTFAYGNPFSLGQARQATPLRPRTVGVQMSANF